jgi:trichohyalin
MKTIPKKIGDELVKTGKTAAKQVVGDKSGDKGIEGIQDATQQAKQVVAQAQKSKSGDAISSEQLSQLRTADDKERSQGLSKTRAELERMKIKRYQEIQQEQLQAARGRDQEKEEKQKQEEMEKEEKKQEEEEKKAQGPLMPESVRKQPGLDRIGRQTKHKKGTKELGRKSG